VAMLDRRWLAVPLSAQAAAFVVVLVIGAATGSHTATPTPSGSPTPTPTPTSSSSPSPRSGVGRTHAGTGPTSPSALAQLTVQATELVNADSGVQVLSIPVEVLQDRKNGAVEASGSLAQEGIQGTFSWTKNLPPDTYQVCLQPPSGTKFVGPNTDALPRYFCMKVSLEPGPATVTFSLARAAG
jgi:hypothetical protein